MTNGKPFWYHTAAHKRRREAWAKYRCHYTLEGQVNDPCVYCERPSHVWDHVPALLAMRDEYIGNIQCRIVRACNHCNMRLGARGLTVLGRRDLLKKKQRAYWRSLS